MEFTLEQTLASMAPSTLVVVVVLLVLRSRVEAHFQQEIEKHKHSLQVVSESLRFHYEQRLRGLDLWAAKAFDVQTSLFSLLSAAVEDVALYLNSEREALVQLDSDGAERYLRLLGDEVCDVEGIVAFWYSDKDNAIEQVERQLFKTREQRARASLRSATAFFKANELYLSSEVASRVCEMLATLHSMSVSRPAANVLEPVSASDWGREALAGLRTVLREATIDQMLRGTPTLARTGPGDAVGTRRGRTQWLAALHLGRKA